MQLKNSFTIVVADQSSVRPVAYLANQLIATLVLELAVPWMSGDSTAMTLLGISDPQVCYRLGSWALLPLQHNKPSIRLWHSPSPSRPPYFLLCPHPIIDLTPTSLAMATPAVPQDLYSYCTLLRSELQRVHDRLDRLEFGDTAASTPRGHAWRFSWDGARWGSAPSTPAPTPAIIAVGHTAIPLAETLPTAEDSPSRYSCTLVVPDSVVGHIVGRGGTTVEVT
ncbi:hypothetical protein R3P38DRAFT_3534383 [Favolaschia claudopus]|uniref:K Homology domain-containing protein n=1 Tax=Favolaschia claudopus TaxID=2862362 RepID=A0AAW0BCH9_9AGAR